MNFAKAKAIALEAVSPQPSGFLFLLDEVQAKDIKVGTSVEIGTGDGGRYQFERIVAVEPGKFYTDDGNGRVQWHQFFITQTKKTA